ncbi:MULTISPECIES: Fur family transcriptional regulator [unclassified Rhodococcus (in: high G+C Gram-positive bacteria)]|uniref:transcriptional repressor n=1 Tax=unclassified Rhodococcus (in: high G+C Gram-positive bacteria) TaxID=192944 RepID=UPI00146D6B05|nr:transcriptional repressor [Rhodococcus sp. BL-253-APC-6A1W]NME78690.1 transcriptional repressor [Rhodococcus sp. 105337]
MPTSREAAQQLRAAGLRVTRQRVAVLDAAGTHPHADAETIFDTVRTALPGISRQTVYDVLHAMTSRGMLRRIEPSGSHARYEARVGDNHHHLVCRACGVIADVNSATGDTPCLTGYDDGDFAVDETEVVFWGLCPGCSSSAASRPQP